VNDLPPARWATADDDPALRRLARRVPIHGPVRYCLEREPEFLALTRLQGRGGRVAVVDGAPGELAAMGMVAPDRLRLFGRTEEIPYAGDLKVDPSFRESGLAGRIYRFLLPEVRAGSAELCSTLVLRGNPLMASIVANRRAAIRYHPVATLHNFTVFFGPRKRAPAGVRVRAARDGDLGAMVELWNRVQAARELSPIWDEAELRRRIALTPGLSIDRYLLAERDGRLVALAALWDARALKQVRLLGLSTGLAWLRRAYNLFGRRRIPRDGEPLPFFYVAQVCAESAADLRALLVEVHERHRGGDHLYFDLALDARDPLLPALDGFWKTSLAFDVYLMDLAGRFAAPPELARPAYFDISLV
jgi:hypothetical protein